MRRLAVLTVFLGLAGCITPGEKRVDTYRLNHNNAVVYVGERKFNLYFNGADQTVLVMRGMGGSVGQALAFGNAGALEPAPIWRAAANAALGQIGCEAIDAYELKSSMYRAFEVTYRCAGGATQPPLTVIESHRVGWLEGIHIPSPL